MNEKICEPEITDAAYEYFKDEYYFIDKGEIPLGKGVSYKADIAMGKSSYSIDKAIEVKGSDPYSVRNGIAQALSYRIIHNVDGGLAAHFDDRVWKMVDELPISGYHYNRDDGITKFTGIGTSNRSDADSKVESNIGENVYEIGKLNHKIDVLENKLAKRTEERNKLQSRIDKIKQESGIVEEMDMLRAENMLLLNNISNMLGTSTMFDDLVTSALEDALDEQVKMKVSNHTTKN